MTRGGFTRRRVEGRQRGVNSESVETEEETITDPDGEGQVIFRGINDDTALQDVDGGASGFSLSDGVLVEKHPDNDKSGYSRLTLGRNLVLGLRKNNTVNGNDAGTSEFLKNPPDIPGVILENDYIDGVLNLETRRGGGVKISTSASSADNSDKIRRFIVPDEEGGEVVPRMESVFGFYLSGPQRFYDAGNAFNVGGDWAGQITPDYANDRFEFETKSQVVQAFRPGFNDVFRISSGRVTVGYGSGNIPLRHVPQDVRNISGPTRGDTAYHDGSGNAGEGIAYYDGSNWNVLDGGTQP